MRDGKGEPMEMSLLVLIGIAVVYAVLILIGAKVEPQRGTTVKISQVQSDLVLQEGQTIIGVMDTKKVMRFYIGNDVMDEKNHEQDLPPVP
jgi:hypothetical protein